MAEMGLGQISGTENGGRCVPSIIHHEFESLILNAPRPF